MNFQQVKAIEYKNKKRLLKVCPELTEESGIYLLTRQENGFKYAYVGQAKHILTRLAEHLKASCGIYDKNTQHIDNSIKNHGLWSEENKTGWKIDFIRYPEQDLNEKEQVWIKEFANAGYQLRNKTTGSQGKGKAVLGDQKERKGYNKGLHKGYENARKEIAKLFDKNLIYIINGKPNKNKQKAFEKFTQFIKGE